MPRKPRFSLPGEYYHVIIRGNNKANIFFSDEDRKHFLSLLEYGVTEYKYKIHAFCLMSNHVHIALQVGEITISKIMHNINFRYAKWVNFHQERVGHVFQGRFKSIFVSRKRHLVELVRYIHLNPIRANIVKYLEDYKWSSHLVYLGEKCIPWVTTDFVLNILDSGGSCRGLSAGSTYIELMRFDVLAKVEDVLGYDNVNYVDDYFMYPTRTEKEVSIDLKALMEFICQQLLVSESDLLSRSRKRDVSYARGVVAWLARELKVASVSECAEVFGRDGSGLMRVVERLAANMECQAVLVRFKEVISQ